MAKLENVKHYSQRDPRWKDDKLGYSDLTMGGYGCLVTAASILLTYLGKEITPGELNQKLKDIGGFNGAYFKYDPFVKQFDMVFSGIENYDSVPAPVERIRTNIEKGLPTIIRVDFVPETRPIDQHFVVVIGYTEKDLIISDPWTGEEYFLTAKYPHNSNAWNQPKYVIYGIREFIPNWDYQSDGNALEECLKQHKDLLDQINAKQTELENCQQRLHKSEVVRRDLGQQVEEFFQENEELRKKLDVCQSFKESANDDLQNKVEKIQKLEDELEATEAQRAKMKTYYEKVLKYDIRKYERSALIGDFIRIMFGVEPKGRPDN